MSEQCDSSGYGISCDNYDRATARIAELEAELAQCLTAHAELNDECERLRDDAITVVRNEFESAAIDAWKSENARLNAECERLRDDAITKEIT
jgi:cell division protein FtsB